MRFRLGNIVGVVAAFVLSTGVAQAAFTPATISAVGATASGIGYGDFNSDGIIDVVVTRPTLNDVVVMLGRPDGTLAPPLAPIPVGQNPVAVTSCITPYMFGLTGGVAGTLWWPGQLPSFNNDPRCDIAVSDAGSGDIAVLMSRGDGTFAPARFIPVDGTPGAIVGDVLDDGAGGVVFAEPQKDRIGVIHFGYHQSFTGPTWTAVGSDPEALAIRPNQFDGVVIVADTGSGDVRDLYPSTDSRPTPRRLDWARTGMLDQVRWRSASDRSVRPSRDAMPEMS